MGVAYHVRHRLAAVLVLGLSLLSPVPAWSQAGTHATPVTTAAAASAPTATSGSPIPDSPANMSSQQLQGVSCIAFGLLTAAGALYYSTTVTLATFAQAWSIPLIAVPVAAGGYAVGCNVGSTTGPGLYWMYAWVQRH